MAQWLSDDEQHVWRSFIAMTGLIWENLDRELQTDAGMPQSYYLILAMLSEAPNRQLRMSELALAANSSQSRLSHAASRLEQRGWITRVPAPDDGRGSLAILTDAGYEVLVAAAPGHVTAVRSALFDPLTEQQVVDLGAMCDAVLNVLDPDMTSRNRGGLKSE
ncbi:MAG: MarR family transcriptional regulator [Actinomycetes bacterium]